LKEKSMDIKAKIDEMERISKEIREELKPMGMSFRWSIDLENHDVDAISLNMGFMFRQLREELYADLIKAGMLPGKSGPENEPDGR
jgi:hypothetical protein